MNHDTFTETQFHLRSISYMLQPVTWSSPVHYHDLASIAVVLNGQGYFKTNNHTINIERGDILLIPAQVHHGIYSVQGLEYATMTFFHADTTYFNGTTSGICSSLSKAGEYTDSLIHMLLLIFSLSKSSDSTATAAMIHAGNACVSLINMISKREATPITRDDIFSEEETISNQIYDYIIENYMEHISLNSLGKHFSISPSRLSHLFALRFGVTPIDMVIQMRIIHSASQLITTTSTIDEIAFNSGFESATNYIRQFKKRMGMTPTSFRKEHDSRIVTFETKELS